MLHPTATNTHDHVDTLPSQPPAPSPADSAPDHPFVTLPFSRVRANDTMAATGPRRRKPIAHRRRVEDDGEEEAAPEVHDLEDDSLTEGSIGSDDDDAAGDSDTSNVDEASPTAPDPRKAAGNGAAKPGRHGKSADVISSGGGGGGGDDQTATPARTAITDTDIMLNGLAIDTTHAAPPLDMNFDDVAQASPAKESAPIVVSSSSAPQAPPHERRRREHEEYRRKRDEDPAFVPNRGAFFMHDHRHAGPAANGFRPFARGGGRGGRGRGGFGPVFAPVQYECSPSRVPFFCVSRAVR